MSYAFIAENVADFPVQAMCAVLGVSRSGYYAWVSRPESPRDQADGALASAIRDAHEASRGRYGSPRVHAELRAQGRQVSRKRVARLMRGMGLAARRRRRFCRTTDSRHGLAVAPNLLQRDFRAPAPDRVWLADITYIVPRVYETNVVAADQMARRAAKLMVAQGWGRILNVTTMYETMVRQASSQYGRRRPRWNARRRSGPAMSRAAG